MSWRKLLGLALLVAVVATGWLAWNRRDRGEPQATATERSDYVLRDFEMAMLGKDGTDQADDGASVREDADHVASAADLPVQAFLGVVRPDLSPHFFRERGEGEDVGAGGFEVVGYGGELPGESINDPVELGIHSVGVGLVVHAVQQRFDPRPAALGGG